MKDSLAAAGNAPVVLLHGQPGARSDWDAVVAALPQQRLCLALDRPGYRGNLSRPGSFTDNASWLLAELDRAEIAQAVLVGHSYGGGVALTLAALAPERVCGLVLVSSVGPGCLDKWDALLAAPLAGPVCALAAWWLTPWFARARLARVERRLGRALQADEHVYWEIWANARHEHGAMWRTFLTEQRELVHGIDQLAARLKQVRSPSLIIADPADPMIPITTAYALRDQLPQARLLLTDNGGHHIPRRSSQLLADQIEQFTALL